MSWHMELAEHVPRCPAGPTGLGGGERLALLHESVCVMGTYVCDACALVCMCVCIHVCAYMCVHGYI